jgi:hypothetical protein
MISAVHMLLAFSGKKKIKNTMQTIALSTIALSPWTSVETFGAKIEHFCTVATDKSRATNRVFAKRAKDSSMHVSCQGELRDERQREKTLPRVSFFRFSGKRTRNLQKHVLSRMFVLHLALAVDAQVKVGTVQTLEPNAENRPIAAVANRSMIHFVQLRLHCHLRRSEIGTLHQNEESLFLFVCFFFFLKFFVR